jgi:pyroglutamyl-peptidase
MTRILLTGFEPFGGAVSNPSEQASRRLAAEALPGAELITAVLPVSARNAPPMLEGLLLEHRPSWCVMLGLAEGRARIGIERVGLNLCDFRIPDNSGDQLVDQPIAAAGPAAYFSALPVRAMYQAMNDAGAPTELSLSAGAYLCNMVFYAARHLCETRGLSTRAGFIHLPATPEQAAQAERALPSMALDTIVAGLHAGLRVLIAQ